MNEKEIISDYIETKWVLANDFVYSENEVDVEVHCDCGNEFWIYVPYTAYKCRCGEVYRVRTILERDKK